MIYYWCHFLKIVIFYISKTKMQIIEKQKLQKKILTTTYCAIAKINYQPIFFF